MNATALDYTYDYRFASHVTGDGIRLSAAGGCAGDARFFRGRLRRPRVIGDLLSVLATVVRTHFHASGPPNLDPVVTSSPAMLRLEGFSGCCGVYARVDLDERALDADVHTFGTTNVDFNEPMRRELGRLRDGEDVRLTVERDGVALERAGAPIAEKRVKLPVRWIKAFGEVQVYQSQLERRWELSAGDFQRLLHALPRHSRQATYAVPSGRSIRISQQPSAAGVPLDAPDRLRVARPLLPHARRIVVWSDAGSGTSAWQVETDSGTLVLLLCAGLYRGFSGEGQLLDKLAGTEWKRALPAIEPLLDWQTTLDPAELAARTGHRVAEVQAALAVLGARGLAGFDASTGYYFHRRLPFDLSKVEQLQPRLRSARRLVAAGGVQVIRRPGGEAWDVEVPGSGVAHHVRLRPDGDRCSCPWFSRHQDRRGPCKHVLAARLLVEGESDDP